MAKFALLIGVSEYEPGLSPLPAAVKDVAAFQRILQDAEMGGFDEVKTLINPDPQSMQYAIETLFTGHSKDDLELLFFSGHGIKDDSNSLHFATRITCKNPKGDLIRSTAVPARFIREVMDNSRTKRQVIILDCCFSGAFDPSLQSKDDGSIDLPGQLGAEGRVVLTSSSSTQYSFEQQGSELSLYTRYLVEGIETGAGDLDEDGKISMRELHDYATSKVQETAPNMTPKLITLKDMGFEIVLAKAKVTDPKLRYRRQVERYSSQGEISSIGKTILSELQIKLGLSALISAEIERETLQPYQDRLKNLQRYQQEFLKSVAIEYPFSTQSESELKDLRDILGLREEDVFSVEDKAISQNYNKRISEKMQDKSLKKELVVNDSVDVIQEEPPSKKKKLFGKGTQRIWSKKNTLQIIALLGASTLLVSGIFIFNRFYINPSFQTVDLTNVLEEKEKEKEKEEIKILINNIFSPDTLIRRESTNTLSNNYLGTRRREIDYHIAKTMTSKYNQDPKNYFGLVNILFLFSKISDENFESNLVEIRQIVQSAKIILSQKDIKTYVEPIEKRILTIKKYDSSAEIKPK
jgi:uncharacterized caspase-like protein